MNLGKCKNEKIDKMNKNQKRLIFIRRREESKVGKIKRKSVKEKRIKIKKNKE